MTFVCGFEKKEKSSMINFLSRCCRSLFVLVLTVILSWSSDAGAGSTQVWVQETYADFNEGEGTGVEVVSTGHLRPGKLFDKNPMKDVSLVFSMLDTPRGVVMGTGDRGEVWIHDGKKGKKIASIKDAVVITSLMEWKDGKILAGTIPDGKIYSVDIATGKTELFSKLGADHIWCMEKDPKSGDVFVGTGPDGKLFRVTQTGKSEVYWDSSEKHILSMSYGPGGLYVGSAPKAIVFKVLGKGRVRAIHDFDATEVRALRGNEKVLFAAVNKMEPAKIGFPKIKAPKGKGTEIKKGKVETKKKERKIPRKGAKKGKGGVFRLWETGAAEQLHGLEKSYFTSLELTPDDNVYAGDGKKGRIFFLGKDGRLSTVVDVKERQVLALNLTGRVSSFATGDGGVLYKRKTSGRRIYKSEVLDTKAASGWGKLEWRGSRKVRMEVRSGNTAEADKTWSKWIGLRNVSANQLGGNGLVRAPAGRYLQYRVSWTAREGEKSNERVEGLRLYFVPVNRRAVVTEVKVHDQKSQDKKSGIRNAPWLKKITMDAPDEMQIEWKAENPDEDPLWYKVAYRGVGQKGWIRLGGEKPLTVNKLKWAVGSIPDGLYMISVTASDARSNPLDLARSHTLVVGPYLVDNTKPFFKSLRVNLPNIQGVVEDAMSRITGVQFSLDGKTWYPVASRDGVFDNSSESFSFRLPKELLEKSRSGLLLIRAFDEAGNAVVEKRTLPVQGRDTKK